MAELSKVCCTCHHWLLIKRQCRCKAPTRDLSCKAVWPITEATDWCGEYVVAAKDDLLARKTFISPHSDWREIEIET
jgi:hypothetical protein